MVACIGRKQMLIIFLYGVCCFLYTVNNKFGNIKGHFEYSLMTFSKVLWEVAPKHCLVLLLPWHTWVHQ